MANEEVLGPRKTMFVLVIVVGCFAVLWPRILSPLILGHTAEQLKPNKFDREAGCCEVMFESELAVLELINEVCSSAVHTAGKLSPYAAAECRKAVNETCGLDIAAFLKRSENVGRSSKKLVEMMKNTNSSCLKEHFGVPVWSLGPHVAMNSWTLHDTVKQERPSVRTGGPHPALRERGRAIPAGAAAPPSIPVAMPPHVRVRSSPLSVYYDLEIKPPPIPGMRPPLGSPGGPVPAPKSSMGFVMPIYTICIILFFVYTLSKILFKRNVTPYETITPDPEFRRRVFRDDSKTSPDKLVVTAISGLVAEVQQQMEASYAQNQQRQDVPDNNTRAYANGTILHNSGPVHIVTSEYRESSKEVISLPEKELQSNEEPKESTPEPKESTPEPKESTPEPKESTPEPKESTPEPKEFTPDPKETTPEPKETTPEPIQPTLELVDSALESVLDQEAPTLLSESIPDQEQPETEAHAAAAETNDTAITDDVTNDVELEENIELVDPKELNAIQNESNAELQYPKTEQREISNNKEDDMIKFSDKLLAEKDADVAKIIENLLEEETNVSNDGNGKDKPSTPDLLAEAIKEDLQNNGEDEEQENASVKVVGMEMTAHAADGGAWPRTEAPLPPPPATPRPHEAEDVKSIFLETEIPQQSRVLIADFGDKPEPPAPTDHSPMVVSGKMTLSLIQDAPRDTPERDPESTVDDFTTASAVTQPAAEKLEELDESDEELEEEIEIEEIEEEVEEEEDEEPVEPLKIEKKVE